MRDESFFRGFLLVVLVCTLWEFLTLLEPFFTPMLGALFLVILTHPLHLRISRFMPKRSPSFHAVVSTSVAVMLIVGPFLTACWILINESQQVIPTVQSGINTLRIWRDGASWMNLTPAQALRQHLPEFLEISTNDLQRMISQGTGIVLGAVSQAGRAVVANAIVSAIHLILLVFTVFFLFRDGETFLEMIKRLIPMQARDKERLLERLKLTILGIVRGSIFTALFQTVSATLAYLIVGTPAAITLGMTTGIASFIPAVGTTLVWLPLGVLYLLKGMYWKGIFILIWGAAVVSTMDNLLRTWLIGKGTKLPILFLFFALLGGAKLYGIRGLLFAPLIVAILPILLDMYEMEYLPGHGK